MRCCYHSCVAGIFYIIFVIKRKQFAVLGCKQQHWRMTKLFFLRRLICRPIVNPLTFMNYFFAWCFNTSDIVWIQYRALDCVEIKHLFFIFCIIPVANLKWEAICSTHSNSTFAFFSFVVNVLPLHLVLLEVWFGSASEGLQITNNLLSVVVTGPKTGSMIFPSKYDVLPGFHDNVNFKSATMGYMSATHRCWFCMSFPIHSTTSSAIPLRGSIARMSEMKMTLRPQYARASSSVNKTW